MRGRRRGAEGGGPASRSRRAGGLREGERGRDPWCPRSAPLPAGHHRQAGAGQAAGALREERARHGPAGDRHAGDQGAVPGGEGGGFTSACPGEGSPAAARAGLSVTANLWARGAAPRF